MKLSDDGMQYWSVQQHWQTAEATSICQPIGPAASGLLDFDTAKADVAAAAQDLRWLRSFAPPEPTPLQALEPSLQHDLCPEYDHPWGPA